MLELHLKARCLVTAYLDTEKKHEIIEDTRMGKPSDDSVQHYNHFLW